MQTNDIISILCKLKYCSYELETVTTTFSYEFSDRKYEIKFQREEGRMVSFQVLDKGEIVHAHNIQ